VIERVDRTGSVARRSVILMSLKRVDRLKNPVPLLHIRCPHCQHRDVINARRPDLLRCSNCDRIEMIHEGERLRPSEHKAAPAPERPKQAAELKQPPRSLRMSRGKRILTPRIPSGLGIGTFSLQHQRQIEYRIKVIGRNNEGLAQALHGGFGAPLVVQYKL